MKGMWGILFKFMTAQKLNSLLGKYRALKMTQRAKHMSLLYHSSVPSGTYQYLRYLDVAGRSYLEPMGCLVATEWSR